jgi:valyl-tRNA synthetase
MNSKTPLNNLNINATYNPSEIEQKWYRNWEQNDFFKPNDNDDSYCIMIPPPNVTGSLHMGHAFQNSIMDLLIRYNRMKGKSTLWQVGTDHAGIATQMVVERQLAQDDISKHDLGRSKFLEKVWDWKSESGGTITHQLRRIGTSIDWSKERFTMDEGFSSSVQEAFIRLYQEGLIYRGKRLVNWDPKLCTAISDLEVVNIEKNGKLWHLKYPLEENVTTLDGAQHLIVATTRPETMLGDSAVGIHPNDERYQHLIGHHVILPITGRKIPIIADDYVDMEFGSGCVKLTPAHDFNDYEVGKRHKLPLINIFDKHAHVLNQAQAFNWDNQEITDIVLDIPEEYKGLERFKARKVIIQHMSDHDLLEKIEDHALNVPKGDRSDVVIEPLLTDQWYVNVKPLAKDAIQAVKDGKIEFVPKQYENMYFSWMNDIQDWCISRQLWWGHRIPAWYDDDNNIYVGQNEQHVREHYKLDASVKLSQDNDVLDTWFSSSLWTFATLGWPNVTSDFKKFHPTDVLVTGFDIIFFWVARMIMMTMHLIKDKDGAPQIPFKKVYVTGLIRDENGQKMSKSKGNVLDPLDMIDGIDAQSLLDKRSSNLMQPKLADKIKKQTQKQFPEGIKAYGTDSLRFTLTSLASTGRDINWDMKRLEGYRNFCNKIWNASRFVLTQSENYDSTSDYTLTTADHLIQAQLNITIDLLHKHINDFRFDLASNLLYEFIWHEFCDWYIELAKTNLITYKDNKQLTQGTLHTLTTTLEIILRMTHPFMPYITEEIWQMLKPICGIDADSIMLQEFPNSDDKIISEESTKEIQWMKDVTSAIRNIRGEMNITPSIKISVLLNKGNEADRTYLHNTSHYLKSLTKLETINFIDAGEKAPLSSIKLIDQLEVLVPMEGLIDKKAEKNRLTNEIGRLEKELTRLGNKLSNTKFIANAPEQVVAVEREKLTSAEASIATLNKKIEQLEQI